MNTHLGFGLEVLVKGQPLREVTHNGTTYFAGLPGEEFSIRVTAPSGGRHLAVLSVDGLDVLTGQPASQDASGLVFTGKWETNGFRIDDRSVAQFFFAGRGRAYADQVGTPTNVGVIAVAIYAERQRPLMRSPELELLSSPTRGGGGTFGATKGGGHDLGAGFGRKQAEAVGRTVFEKASETPVAVLVLEYATADSLKAKGIPIDPPLGAVNPFPADSKPATGAKPPPGWNPSTGTSTPAGPRSAKPASRRG